jgi:hypothetical protein
MVPGRLLPSGPLSGGLFAGLGCDAAAIANAGAAGTGG